MKGKNSGIIKGQDIEKLSTLGTIYDNNCLQVCINGYNYRIKAEEILKMVNEFKFKKLKKKKYVYLEVDMEE